MPRKLFTTREFLALGHSEKELYWGQRAGKWVHAAHGVFAEGPDEPDAMTAAVARLMASGEVATGLVSGAVYGLDAIEPKTLIVPRRRRAVAFGGEPRMVEGVLCACPVQTIIELAAILDDLRWEQALESALRKGLLTIEQLENLLPELAGSRTHGSPRIRRVLALRPPGAPPTGSLMETLMVQLVRPIPEIPEPERQVVVTDEHDEFVAQVDLAWSDLGVLNELDGLQHLGQPVHDARRESAVVAATGWLVGRFTWREVRDVPIATGRRLVKIIEQARRRPLPF
ncbi:MAG: DUF559 domain-containing protein [Actinobacteria bacterium]|nr:DUF559 domain-containing protein [Actinomycetota bacterium]